MPSELIGSLLLMAVMMTGAALVLVNITSAPMPTPTPAFNFAAVRVNESTIRIHHTGGDSIGLGRLRVFIDGEDLTAGIRGAWPWATGGDLFIDAPEDCRGTLVLAWSGDGACWRCMPVGVP